MQRTPTRPATGRHTTRHAAVLLVVPLLALVAACGSDDETTTQRPGATATTAPAPEEGASEDGEARPGSGTVTVAGTSFPFTAETCDLGDEIDVEGEGEADGRAYGVTVTTSTSESGISRESVRLVFSPQELSTLTNLYTRDTGDADFTVDGDRLTAEGEFLSAGGAPAGPGTLEVTCG